MLCILFYCIFGYSADHETESRRDRERRLNNRLAHLEFLIRFGQYWNAYTELTTIINQEQTPFNRLYKLRAQCTLNMGMTAECLRDCNSILKNSPTKEDRNDAYLLSSRAHIQVGEYDEALEAAIEGNNKQLQSNCDQLMKLADDANAKYEEGELNEAARIFDTILQNSPKAKEFIQKRANIAFLTLDYNKFKQVIKGYEKEFSSDAVFVYRLGVITFCDGQMGDAMNKVQRAMKLRGAPRNCSSTLKDIEKVNKHYPIAERFLENKDIESAQREIVLTKKTSELYCPHDSVLLKQIKNFELKILKTQHTPEEMLDILVEMLEKDPYNVDFLIEKGDINVELKEYNAALFDYQKAQNYRPNDNRIQQKIKNAQELQKKATYVDYYEILGVEKTASIFEIKNAYKKLVREWHPDRYGDPVKKKEAEMKMKKINQAYDILGDQQKKQLYDAGEDPFAPSQSGGGGARFFHFGNGGEFHFEFHF